MKSKEISEIQEANADPLWQIAYQLALLNERIEAGDLQIQIVGAAGTDLHGLFYALSAFAKRKGLHK